MVKVKTKASQKGTRKPASCKEPTQCPHEHFRYDVPDRRGIARDKHTNILATPRGYPWEDVKRESGDGERSAKKTPIHRRSCPDKYEKKPEKAYVHNFLAEIWSFLTPEMADRLKNMLMSEFSMSSNDAEEFIFKQREANIVNSSTVSLYKKPRDIGDGKVVLDSVIKLRTPNKTYCDKFPKSTIGIRNSWIKDFSDLISDKMADYVLETMSAERTERQQEIAQNLLSNFNKVLEQKASLANPKTQTHKTMVLAADRLSLWLDKNVPMAKETAQRLRDIEEAQERKKSEDERRKRMKEEGKQKAESVGEEGGEEEEEQMEERDEGPGGPPGAPGAEPVEPGAMPEEPEAKSAETGDQREEPEAESTEPGVQPGEPEATAQEPGAESSEPGVQPGEPEATAQEPGAESNEPGVQPGEPEPTAEEGGAQPGEAAVEPTGTAEEPEATEDDRTKPAAAEEQTAVDASQPVESDGAQQGISDETQPRSPEELTGKEDEDKTGAPNAEEAQPTERDEPSGKAEEESRAEEPPPTETQPEEANKDVIQPGTSDEGKPLEEPKGAEYEDVQRTSAQAEPTSEQTEPPPSDEEIQPTASEIQQKAAEEVVGEEKADGGPQDTTLPGDTDQEISAGDTSSPGLPVEKSGSAPEQMVASEDAADENKLPAATEGQPTDQKDGEPTTKPGEMLSSPGSAAEPTPEQQRQLDVIKSVTSKILETPVEGTPRQEAIKDILEKQLERDLGDDDKPTIDFVASKVSSWIDKMVEQVESEYGDRSRSTVTGVPSEPGRKPYPPVTQKPKGSIFVVKKVDDRRGFDVDVISNTRALGKIRLARGKSPARADVPNPESALEPADLKNWAQWASAVSDMAQSWAEWIEDTVQEAQKRGEILQTDDSPERLREWDDFRGKKAHGAQQWRKTKEEVVQTANLWSKKGMKTQELRKPET